MTLRHAVVCPLIGITERGRASYPQLYYYCRAAIGIYAFVHEQIPLYPFPLNYAARRKLGSK